MTLGDRQTNNGLEDLLARTSEHVIGLDGVAIIVPLGEPTPNMTIADAARIFCQGSRPIEMWSDFHGPNVKVTRVIRNEGSGTRDFFDQRVCGGSKKTPKLRRSEFELDSPELVAKVKSLPGSIGFVSSSLAAGTATIALAKDLVANYWGPTAENIKRFPMPAS